MKKHLSTLILLLILLTGLSLLLYPTVSNYWNSFHQSRAISSYEEQLEGLDEEAFAQMRAEAERYNQELREKSGRYRYRLSDQEMEWYNRTLNPGGSGIMGYIEIPILKVKLSIYHGVDESVLQIAAGHIESSSLPVGGPGTHCALSGHRGLPSARLFTDLDKLVEGDIFILHVLDEELTYQVDQISIVDPDDLSMLQIEDDKDYCTLITCTPYAVNTHRLLVRGHRVDNLPEDVPVHIEADAKQIDPLKVVPFIAAPLLAGLFIMMLIQDRCRRKKRRQNMENQKEQGEHEL